MGRGLVAVRGSVTGRGAHGGEGLNRDKGLVVCSGWQVWVGSALKRERNGGKEKKSRGHLESP